MTAKKRMVRVALMAVLVALLASFGCGPNTDDCRILKVCETGGGGSGKGGDGAQGGQGGGGSRPIPEECGDGILQPELGEECDDGNDVDGDDCEADCRLPRCQNGIPDRGEVCLPSQASISVLGGGASRFGAYIGSTDCDADGDLDLLLMAGDEGSGPMDILALRNIGDGTFLPPVVSPTPFGSGRAATLAKIDGDALPDVVLLGAVDNNSPTEIRWFSGGGACNFGSGSLIPQSAGAVAVAAGNLDGDARDDLLFLIATGAPPNSTYSYRSFRSASGTTSGSTAMAQFTDIALGNVGSSNIDDLVYLAPNGDVEVRFGLGGGSVGPPQSFSTETTNPAYARIGVFDVDGSGVADVLMVNLVESWLQALLSDGAGTLSASSTVSTEGSTAVKGVEPVQIAGGDLDNDGIADVVVASTGGLFTQKVFPLTVSVFRGGASSTPPILDQALCANVM